MKITDLGKVVTAFEYHESVNGELIHAEALTHGRSIQIVSGQMEYTVSLDDLGALVIRAYGRGMEALNISPRSSNEVRIWCEMWRADK